MIFNKIPGVVFVESQKAGADGNITNISLTNDNQIRFSGPAISSRRQREDLLKAFGIIDQRR